MVGVTGGPWRLFVGPSVIDDSGDAGGVAAAAAANVGWLLSVPGTC